MIRNKMISRFNQLIIKNKIEKMIQDDENKSYSSKPLEVLIACEFSGIVRDAFISLGHKAISCDLLPTEAYGPHYKGDVRDIIHYPWDLVIAHPPCTHLCCSGARYFKEKEWDGRRHQGVSFFMMFAKLEVKKIAIENPICIMSSLWRKPDQIIQPYQFGHGETKATCLWLKGLDPLKPTKEAEGREQKIQEMFFLLNEENRWKERSKTYLGIAAAMASQWGGVIKNGAV